MSAGGEARGAPHPAPDEWNARALAAVCAGRAFIARCIWLDEVDSTQDELRRLVDAAAARPRRLVGTAARPVAARALLVAAACQTAGRGRRGRAWHSPAGRGLWFSLLLHPKRPRAEWPFLTALAALALRRALRATARLECAIKWPNDLLCAGRKVAGILAETFAGEVALGIGVNLGQSEEEFPEELRERAVSVATAAGAAPAAAILLAAFLDEFEAGMERFDREGSAPFRDELRAASILIGRTVRLDDGRAGKVADIGPAGELLLEADGASARLSVASGEVVGVEPPLGPRERSSGGSRATPRG